MNRGTICCAISRFTMRADCCERVTQVAHFRFHWDRRQPVVVRDIPKTASWDPNIILAAMMNAAVSEKANVISCKDGGTEANRVTLQKFFNKLQTAVKDFHNLHKIKDVPSTDAFDNLLPRHWLAFMESLPFPVRPVPPLQM